MKLKLAERRKYIRIEAPFKIKAACGDFSENVVAKNISPVGMRFETSKKMDQSKPVSLSLSIPKTKKSVNMKGKIAWQAKISLEDNAPFDNGIEITEIADKDKNTFLEFLCDILYGSPEYIPREE
jgi:hypothetical protein